MKDHIRLLRAALWVSAALVLVVVVTLSLVPQPSAPIVLWDKLWHSLAYASLVMGLLLAAVWAPGLGAGRWPRAYAGLVAGTIALGAVIEILQGTYFMRSPDLLDVLANSVGAVAGGTIWRSLRRVY